MRTKVKTSRLNCGSTGQVGTPRRSSDRVIAGRLPSKRTAGLSKRRAGANHQERTEYQYGEMVSCHRFDHLEGGAGAADFGISTGGLGSINSSKSWWASRNRGASSSDLRTSRRASCFLPD